MTAETAAYFASVLGLESAQRELFARYVRTLERYSGRPDAIDDLREQNAARWSKALNALHIDPAAEASIIQGALQGQMQRLNTELLAFFEAPDLSRQSAWTQIMQQMLLSARTDLEVEVEEGVKGGANHAAVKTNGFFLKYDVAVQLVRDCPPQILLDHFQLGTVDALLAQCTIHEIYAALRFAMTAEWNAQFISQYDRLTPADFEERAIETVVLDPDRWFGLARNFQAAKLHPLSHVKELGVIFVVPNPDDAEQRQRLTIFVTLFLHYFYEVRFYATYLQCASLEHPDRFGIILHQMIIGGIVADPVPENGVRITHQYYTKKDHPDPRVFEPHVMPEPLHWRNAQRALRRLLQSKKSDGAPTIATAPATSAADILDALANCSAVATVRNQSVLSLNLADLVVSATPSVPQKTYHLFEDLWNSIFEAQYSESLLREALLDRLEEGYIDLSHFSSTPQI